MKKNEKKNDAVFPPFNKRMLKTVNPQQHSDETRATLRSRLPAETVSRSEDELLVQLTGSLVCSGTKRVRPRSRVASAVAALRCASLTLVSHVVTVRRRHGAPRVSGSDHPAPVQ